MGSVHELVWLKLPACQDSAFVEEQSVLNMVGGKEKGESRLVVTS